MNDSLFSRLLKYYNITENEYFDLTSSVHENDFLLGHTFKQIEEAIMLVRTIMKQNGKILIYGDYDADGVMGTSILVKMFQYENYDVDFYLPNRYEDGYGLTLKKAQEAIDNGVSLVIMVDNGISAFEPISLLKKNDVSTIVIDHHQPQECLPEANHIVHYLLSDFGDVPTSGAFTAFVFSLCFLNRYDKYLATLASISLISDMMPLKQYNRNLLRLVFSNYQDGEFYQIDALKENEPFNETTIGMKIAPKINAIGRIIDGVEINRLVTFFTEDNRSDMARYVQWINDVNEERKNTCRIAAESLVAFNKDDPAIVYISDAKEGILGLIANQLCSKYHVPTIVFSYDKNKELLKGSSRSPEGFDIVSAFSSLSQYLHTFGGHSMAAGCSLLPQHFENFKKAFMDIAYKKPIEYVKKDNIALKITEINDENYRLIETFSPFGECWKAPLFLLKRINVSSLFFSRDGKHIITQIGQRTRLTGFNISKDTLKNEHYVDFLGTLRMNTYRGITNIEFLIQDIYKE